MTKPIRIVFAVDSFCIGGTELNALRTALRLDRDRYDLRVISLRPEGPLLARYEQAGIPVHDFAISSLWSPRTMRTGVRLARFLRQHRIQVLHAHDVYTNCFAVPWARLAGTPVVIASRRWWHTVPRPALRHANRVAYRFAHRVLANSAQVARLLSEEEGIHPSRILTISNFVEDEAFQPPTDESVTGFRRRLGLEPGDDTTVVGIVARLDPVKHHELLIRAARVLLDRGHRVRFAIVGDGDCREALEAEVRLLGVGDAVHFAGMLPNRPNPHALFDISVLCSSAEGFPNSIVEAMAAGRPVVATRVGGVPDAVVDGQTGLLIPPGDHEALAASLESLLADLPRRRALGEAGRARARAVFSEESVVPVLESAYRDLVRSSDRGMSRHQQMPS